MRTLLNTIAIEPNRWTQEKIPARDLMELLPAIGDAGFTGLEIWQYHFSRKTDADLKALREAASGRGLSFEIAGLYPLFHLEGEEGNAAEREMHGLLDRAALLGVERIKFFFGRVAARNITPRQLELTHSRVRAWIHYGRHEHGLGFCAELHQGTLFDPFEYGRAYLDSNQELDLKVCWQPYSGDTTERCLEIIQGLGPAMVHAHFQASNAQGRCLLPEAGLDYRRIVPALQAANPDFLPSIEFVRGGFGSAEHPFSLSNALADAVADATWIDALLASEAPRSGARHPYA